MSYWMVALTPWARSGLNRPGIAPNVSGTVAITPPPPGSRV
jgi:hypothetical protein